MKYGSKIKKIKELKNIQSKEVAALLKITPQAYSKIERNETNVSDEKLIKIAKFFKIEPDFIKNFDESVYFNNITNKQGCVGINNTYQETSNAEIVKSVVDLSKQLKELIQNQNKIFEAMLKSLNNK